MANELVALRLSGDILKQLDEYAALLAQLAGVPVTRTDVLRKLITEGLAKSQAKRRKK